MQEEIEVTRIPPFPSRQMVIAAANMLKAEGHSGFEALRLEFGLESTDAGTGSGLQERANTLAKYALEDPERRTPDGIGLQSAIVARAGEHYRSGTRNNIGDKERNAFKAASAVGGRLNDVTESGTTVVLTNDDGIASAAATNPSGFEASVTPKSPAPKAKSKQRIFIVHGHDEGPLHKMARFLESVGLEPIILQEQPDKGLTVIEKFLEYADQVQFAVVLLTPDDLGGASASPIQQERARQNVIFELGFFVGSVGRGHVCLMRKGGVEIPSDLAGVIYTELDVADGWKLKLARELKAAGFNVDVNRVVK